MSKKRFHKSIAKNLYAIIKEAKFEDYILSDYSRHPEKIVGAIRQHSKNPDRIRFPKDLGASNDQKTRYGFLYSIFNSMKVKYGLSDYSGREVFIEHFIYDKKFNKIFQAYEDSDFNFFMKPKFTHTSLSDIKLVKKGYEPKYLRRTNVESGQIKHYISVSDAAKHSTVSVSTVSKALRDGKVVGNVFKFKYVSEKTDEEYVKNRKNFSLLDIDGAMTGIVEKPKKK